MKGSKGQTKRSTKETKAKPAASFPKPSALTQQLLKAKPSMSVGGKDSKEEPEKSPRVPASKAPAEKTPPNIKQAIAVENPAAPSPPKDAEKKIKVDAKPPAADTKEEKSAKKDVVDLPVDSRATSVSNKTDVTRFMLTLCYLILRGS